MAAQPLHELFDREKLIKKRFKVKGHFVDFPPTRFSGDEDGEEKKENPITTKAMEMNVTALKVMFSYYKVTSGKKVPIQKLESAVKKLYEERGCEPNPKLGDKQYYLDAWAQGVRELFGIIKALRDGEADGEDSANGDTEGEEEEDGEDDPVSEEAEAPSSEARVSDKSVEDEDVGLGVKAVLADLELDPDEDAQAPKCRYRSKSTLNSLATTAVLGGGSKEILETPESYKNPVPGSMEDELQKLLQQIALMEVGINKTIFWVCGLWQADTFVPAAPPIEPMHKEGGLDGDQSGLALVEVDSSPEKIKPEPQSPNANPGDELAKPVSLDAQNNLRTDLRAKLRRVKGGKNGGKKKGKVSSDKGGEDAAPATKRKRGTCESEPAASSLPKAKAKDVRKRTVEVQISRSKSNDLTIVCGWYTKEKMRTVLKFAPCGQRIKKVVKYCMNPKRTKTHTRRDKYEKDKIEFWVEEETKGSYKISHTEAWNDRREMDLTDDMQAGSPKSKSEALEEEARSEAIENAGTLMQQLLRVQSKVELCAGSLDQMNAYSVKLSGYHDELAELKASYAGSKKSICSKSVTKLQDIIVQAGCARFGMEETKLKRTLLKKPSSKNVGESEAEAPQARRNGDEWNHVVRLQRLWPSVSPLGLHATGHDNRLPDVLLDFKLQEAFGNGIENFIRSMMYLLIMLPIYTLVCQCSKQSGASGVNLLGSTFCTRFLYSVLLARTYSTKKKILYALLDHWQEDLNDCYKNGIQIDGVAGLNKVFPVVINCKGDWPALTKAGRLTRHHLRDAPTSDNPPGICHLCRAGQSGFAWNEFEADAKWLHADNPLPWTTASPLAKLPHDRGDAAAFYCIDLFHVTLTDYEMVGSGQFTKRLDSFFAELQDWCKATGHYLNMVRLTKDLLGIDTGADFPAVVQGKCVLFAIYDGLVAINTFMRKVYALPLWVKPADALELASQGLLFMRQFNAAARLCLAAGKPRFKFMPKFHLWSHLVHYLRRSAESHIDSLNIIAFSCQLDEDFIGRIAAQSRNVSIRTVHQRTVQRYLMNFALRW
ncbi:unnamed protein product [Symbiodinium sp. KB8]|nr:unnamed protein product [Symbiodinium sp. KB8]